MRQLLLVILFDKKLSYATQIPNCSAWSWGQGETECPSHSDWLDGISPGGQSGLDVKTILLPTDILDLMAPAQTATGPRPRNTVCSQLT